MSDIRRQQNSNLIDQLELLERENSDLHRTIEELNQRYDERLRFKDDTIQGLTEQIADLEGALRSKDKATRMSGSELEELRRENGQLRDQLLDKYTKELSDEALNREISNVRDPASFQALKSILSRLERQKQENNNLKREIEAAGSLQRSLGDASSKLKQKDSEIKTLQAEIKKLMIQNEFLLREYEFLQKKHNQGVKRKIGNDEVVQPGGEGYSDAKTSGVLEEICTILKIRDQSKLISSVKMIEEAYRLLPGLQNTVETIFKTVSENPVFDTPLNSYDDLIDAVENWGHNLADYQSLVNGLLETLEIDNEEQKTVSFILEEVNLWKTKLGVARPTLHTKEFTKSENDHLASLLREYLQRESNDEILEAVVTLQKKSDSLQGFVRDAKHKLRAVEGYSDEAILAKVTRFLSVHADK